MKETVKKRLIELYESEIEQVNSEINDTESWQLGYSEIDLVENRESVNEYISVLNDLAQKIREACDD